MTFKKGHKNIPWNKGKKGVFSKETLERMSLSGMGHVVTEEARRKIGDANRGNVPWNKGRLCSEKTKQKIREANTGKVRSEETKEKIRLNKIGNIPWNKGKKGVYSKESLEKMQVSHIGRKPKESTIKKMRGRIPWNKGKTRIYTEETLEKMRLASTGRVPWNKGRTNCYNEETLKVLSLANKGQVPWNKGRPGYKNGPHTEKTKQKMSIAKMGHIVTEGTREKLRIINIDWDFYNEHGCLKHNYPYNDCFTEHFKDMVRARDGNKCVVTGMTNEEHKGKYGRALNVHHWTYDKDETNPFYFVTVTCGINAMAEKNRGEWCDMFNGIMKDKYCEMMQIDSQTTVEH